MFNRTKPTFNTDSCGYISSGPTQRTGVSLVTWFDNTSHIKWRGDLRSYVYSKSGESKWWPTQRGISMPMEIVIGLNNALVKLPIDAPVLEKDECREIERFAKYKDKHICLSVIHYENEVKIDVREFMTTDNGYTGFTNKGVRLPYGLRGDLSKLLMICINKMTDLEKAEINKTLSNTNPKRKKEVEEETAF